MLPIVVDAGRSEIALIGRGEVFVRRLEWLMAGGARRLTLFTDGPAPALLPDAVPLVPGLPEARLLDGFRLVWIAGLPLATASGLARAARGGGALVNVEDVPALCDFHTPAVVRRGDLLVGISTGGRSPALAVRLRRWLEARLGEEWAGRLDLLARKRATWRRGRRPTAELSALAQAEMSRRGWLAPEAGR